MDKVSFRNTNKTGFSNWEMITNSLARRHDVLYCGKSTQGCGRLQLGKVNDPHRLYQQASVHHCKAVVTGILLGPAQSNLTVPARTSENGLYAAKRVAFRVINLNTYPSIAVLAR